MTAPPGASKASTTSASRGTVRVRRAACPECLQLSRGGGAARSPGRARGGARAIRHRAAGRRWRVRRAPALPRLQPARPLGTGGRGDHAGRWQPAAAARGRSRGVPEPLPPADPREDARAEGGRRRHVRRAGRVLERPRLLDRWRPRPGGGRARARGRARRPRVPRAARRHLRPLRRLRRAAAPPEPPGGGAQRVAARRGRAAAPGPARHQRAPAHRARGPPAARRAHVHPRAHYPRGRGPAARAQQRALHEERPRDGAALRGLSRGGGQYRRAGAASRLHLEGPGLPVPRVSAAPRRDAARLPARAGPRGGPRPLPRRCPRRESAAADRARAGPDRPPRPGRVFPHRLGPRPVLPRPRRAGAGTRLGGQQRGVLRARPHRGGSGGHGAALRALSFRGARRVARHRPRPAERRPARAGDPVRLRALRAPRRGHDRQRDHLSRAQRGAGSRQDPGAARRHDRAALPAREQLGVHGSGRQPARASGRSRLRSRGAAHPALRPALERHPGSTAAPGPALGRHGDRPGAPRRRGAARARHHARPQRGAVGQGRLRRARHRQGGSPGARHDVAAPGRARDDPAPRRRGGPGPSPPERSEGVRHAPAGRHHRGFPGGEPRPDGDPAAPAPHVLLRSGGAGGHHPAGSHRGRHGASVFAPPRGA